MNLSTLRAQLNDYGRWFWTHILNRLIFVVIAEVFIFYFLRSLTTDVADSFNPMLSTFSIMAVLPAFPFSDTIRSWYVSMEFTRPVSTLQLVVVPMVLTVMVALATFLIPASLLLLLVDAKLPLVGPLALVVCGVCCLFASASTPSTTVGRWIGTTITASAMLGFYLLLLNHLRQGSQDSQWIVSKEAAYWSFSWAAYSGLALVTTAAIASSFLGVKGRRYGGSIWSVLRFPRIVFSRYENQGRNQVVSTRLSNKPFRNQWTTQCWYDFRKIKRLLLYPIFLFPIAIVAFVILGNYIDPGVEETLYVLACSVFLCPFLCQFFATMAIHPASAGMRNQYMACPMAVFDATRPIRSDHLVAIKLLLVAGWSLVSMIIMSVAALIYLRFIGDWEAVMEIAESILAPVGQISAYWILAAVLGGVLILVSSAAFWMAVSNLLHVLLQPRLFVCSCVLVAFGFLLAIVDRFSNLSVRPAWTVLAYLLASGVVVLCFVGIKKSLSSGLLCRQFLGVTISVWALFVCVMIAMIVKIWPAIPETTPVFLYIFAVVALLIPLASATTAPLGLAQQRHG